MKMSKRIATSPAESEKAKKQDEKATPVSPPPGTSGIMSYFRSKSAAPAATAADDGTSGTGEAGEPTGQPEGEWQTQSRRSPQRKSPTRLYSEAAGSRNQNHNHSENISEEQQPRRAGPNPDFLHPHTHPVFSSKNEGAFRDFFDIEIRTINGQPFRGSITYKEAKHSIYHEILEMDFSNFRGVRLGFKGVPTATILLKTQINLDDLEHVQNFEFTRNYKKLNKSTKLWDDVVGTLGCKIKGVRTVRGGEASVPYSEDWTRVVKIEGCDYMVDADTIINFLGHYGEVTSDLVEDVFEDEENSEGDNATGIYSVKVKLARAIPQLVPIGGKRLKIYYRNIQKLCTKCFGEHYARNCTNQRVPWVEYVKNFISTNTEIDKTLFGNLNQILERARTEETIQDASNTILHQPDQTTRQSDENPEPNTKERREESEQAQPTQDQEPTGPAPAPADFALPETDELICELIEKMTACGMTHADAEANIEKRRKSYQQALKKHQQTSKAIKRGRPPKSRKNSLNA